MRTYYYAGAPLKPGTELPANVTGECEHKHQSPETARRCIAALDASIKRGNGPMSYCDRVVMVREADGHSHVYVSES